MLDAMSISASVRCTLRTNLFDTLILSPAGVTGKGPLHRNFVVLGCFLFGEAKESDWPPAPPGKSRAVRSHGQIKISGSGMGLSLLPDECQMHECSKNIGMLKTAPGCSVEP